MSWKFAFSRETLGYSIELRDLLIEHLDGRPISIEGARPKRMRGFKALARHGLTVLEPSYRPTRSMITEEGRTELSNVLADYAEALDRALEHDLRRPRRLSREWTIRRRVRVNRPQFPESSRVATA